jgi:hypothetical protein
MDSIYDLTQNMCVFGGILMFLVGILSLWVLVKITIFTNDTY